MNGHIDDDLKARFGRLRSETEAQGRVPDFRSMMEEARRGAQAEPALGVVDGGTTGDVGPEATRRVRHRRILRAGAWGSAALAAGLAAVVFGRGPTADADADFERLVASYSTQTSTGTWRSPTSGLLEVPGLDLMRSMPSIGGSIRGLTPGSVPSATPPEPEERT